MEIKINLEGEECGEVLDGDIIRYRIIIDLCRFCEKGSTEKQKGEENE